MFGSPKTNHRSWVRILCRIENFQTGFDYGTGIVRASDFRKFQNFVSFEMKRSLEPRDQSRMKRKFFVCLSGLRKNGTVVVHRRMIGNCRFHILLVRRNKMDSSFSILISRSKPQADRRPDSARANVLSLRSSFLCASHILQSDPD